MILKCFDYSEFLGQPNAWSVKKFLLNDKVNLLVGKNATGKSRTLDRINWLGNMLTGLSPRSTDLVDAASFSVEYNDISGDYFYTLKTQNLQIISEELSISNGNKIDTVLKRKENGEGDILYSGTSENVRFKLPNNQPAAFLKRDLLQHPFLEQIFSWADGIRYFSFGTSNGKVAFLTPQDIEKIENLSADQKIKNSDNASALYLAGEKEYGSIFKQEIIEYMGRIGYGLNDISLLQNPYSAIQINDGMPIIMLSLKEADRNTRLFQSQMSQGMFRALFLLIQIVYNLHKKGSSTFIIDDIGEGLDFDRSSDLIKLLIELAENHDNFQLIMSTNDRYVMNNVPLEYWQLIQRAGGECQVFNCRNKKEKFEEFQYMGLNNFDFLATDYINSEWQEL